MTTLLNSLFEGDPRCAVLAQPPDLAPKDFDRQAFVAELSQVNETVWAARLRRGAFCVLGLAGSNDAALRRMISLFREVPKSQIVTMGSEEPSKFDLLLNMRKLYWARPVSEAKKTFL